MEGNRYVGFLITVTGVGISELRRSSALDKGAMNSIWKRCDNSINQSILVDRMETHSLWHS